MPTVTLSTLRDSVLREADLRASQVDNADLDPLINDGLGELNELMIAAHEGYRYNFASVVVASLTGSLPSDFHYAVDVHDFDSSGNPTVWMPNFEFADRESVVKHSWCVHGDLLHVYPRSKAPGTYFLTYVPMFVALVNPGDGFSCPPRWERYAVIQAAIRLRTAQELSASGLEERLKEVREKIEVAARRRKGRRKVRDVRAGAYDWLFGASLDDQVDP